MTNEPIKSQLISIEEEIQNRLFEIEQFKKQKEVLLQISPECLLAVDLHFLFCTRDHRDQCGWPNGIERGEHIWTEHAHKKWLNVATKVYNKCKVNNLKVDVFLSIAKELMYIL